MTDTSSHRALGLDIVVHGEYSGVQIRPKYGGLTGILTAFTTTQVLTPIHAAKAQVTLPRRRTWDINFTGILGGHGNDSGNNPYSRSYGVGYTA